MSRKRVASSEGITTTIDEAALQRNYYSQSSLDSLHLGGGSWNDIEDLNINPEEQLAPHKLVLSMSSQQQLLGGERFRNEYSRISECWFQYCFNRSTEYVNTI